MRTFRTEITTRYLYQGTELEKELLHETRLTVYSGPAWYRALSVTASDGPRYGGQWETTVNWSACGSVPTEMAQTYAEMLAYAAQLIDGIRLQREAIQAQIAAIEVDRATAIAVAQARQETEA